MATIAEKLHYDHENDRVVHQKVHDYTQNLQRAEKMRQHGGKFGESQMVGTIDLDLLASVMKERGVRWDDKEARNDIVMMMLKSRDFSKLRVYEGNL